ncbi:formate dehydrogenase subunit gamma [Sphaerotilus sp.]|uniref:formate dehydrogenase subunit gamma n=1 Tax=Sphaerotilus sp. TaxID=2093942 RepID=UPI002ACDB2A9|nr:formate dehydrogenase subunit gamma [Sphaerotilus sp.]MDZ7856371.1 formate dehydrogenase subunit gamma [Sphaerotilus sp.]
MSKLIRPLGTLLLAAALLGAGPAGAQTADAASAPAMTGAPAGYVAPAEPRPDDTAAERSKSQPGNNAPVWRAVRDTGAVAGYTSLPGVEQGVLIQSMTQYPGSRLTTAGEAWRQVRNQWIIPYGGSLLLIVALAIGLFYWRKGALGGHEPDTGRMIERFTPLERAAHWTNATAFVVLAVSGIVMAFGKFFLLPVLGHTLFGWLTYVLKNAHNFAGPLFAVSLTVVILIFVKDNIASRADFVWLSKAGGLFGKEEIPSHRFNAGEKGMFWWGVTIPGVFIVASGLVLDKLVPGFGELRSEMQIAHMVHAAAAMVMMAILMGHIYMGTLGMKGAYSAMRTGYVDEGWAKEHHALWYDDVKAGKIPAQRSTPVASSVAPQPHASRPA